MNLFRRLVPRSRAARCGDWFQTATGRRFYPFDIHRGDFSIADVALSLGNICRFNGHCQPFYSVAQYHYLCRR